METLAVDELEALAQELIAEGIPAAEAYALAPQLARELAGIDANAVEVPLARLPQAHVVAGLRGGVIVRRTEGEQVWLSAAEIPAIAAALLALISPSCTCAMAA